MIVSIVGGAIITLVSMFLIMPSLINYLHKIKFGQTEREEGLESHKKKNGTPTMGGIAFIAVPTVVYLVLSLFGFYHIDLDVIILLLAYIGYGLIGFIDDYIIVVQKNNAGLKPKVKFLMQSVLAVVFFLLYISATSTELYIPVVHKSISIGFLYFFLIFLMFTAETNAVNLTDGLDGLCSGQMIIALVPFVIFAFKQGLSSVAIYLILVICSLIGYLFFNKHPAKIFMGDTGSLALGGLFAATGMVLKQEILLIIIGAVFVAETLSVVIQVTYYKRTKKRIFRMAPLHHHYEKGGMKETEVVKNFWIAGAIFAVIGLLLGVI